MLKVHLSLSTAVWEVPSRKIIKFDLRFYNLTGTPILINCLRGSVQQEDEADHLECMKILVGQQLPLNITDASSKTVIHWAVALKKIEICRYLLQKGAPTNELDGNKMVPLHVAISLKSEEFVKILCEFGPPEMLETYDNMGRTPLCHALFIGSPKIFLQLLTAGANVNRETNNGKKLIAHCIESPNAKDFLNIMLKHNVSLFPKEETQFSMVHLASIQKDSASLKIIASYCTKVELNSSDSSGKTPLMYAVHHGFDKNLKMLLHKEVDLSVVDVDGKNPLHFTDKNDNSNCVDLLLNYDPTLLNKPSKAEKYPIHGAIMANNPVVVRAMLERGMDTQLIDDEGHTLIHYATEYSSLACLPHLLAVGISVDTPDKHGTYPLHYAVRLEAAERIDKKSAFLKKLIQVGVKLDVVDGQGLQAIHWAVCMGNYEALKLFLIEDVDVNVISKEQRYTPLHLSCLWSQLNCVELLLHQPNVMLDQKDAKGYTPLIYACVLDNPKYAELLLDAGANPDAQGNDGKTPAHSAAANKSADCLWFLSMKKANLNAKNSLGETPMHVACMNADDACLRFLLSRKCDVNASFNGGVTPLHIAVTSKNGQRTKILLEHKANCNVILCGKENFTPLDIALENGDYEIIRLLQHYGARTAHAIVSHAALSIQHWWKKWKKHRKGGVPFSNDSSLCNSSNASESVSVRDAKKYQRYNDVKLPIDVASSGGAPSSVVDNESVKMSDSVSQHTPKQYVVPDVDDWLNGKKQREHEETIKAGELEIQLMRELMKETEFLLVRVRNVNKEAENMINSEDLRLIKHSNKLYIEERRTAKEKERKYYLQRLAEENAR